MSTGTAPTDSGSVARSTSPHSGKPGAVGRLQCVVVTPERTVLDQHVDFVALPLFDGELGVLPGRSPLIGRLGYGALRTRQGSAVEVHYVDGGFAQVRDNIVTVLTSQAIPVDRLDAAKATEELNQARARVATSEAAQEEKQRDIARARAQIRMAILP